MKTKLLARFRVHFSLFSELKCQTDPAIKLTEAREKIKKRQDFAKEKKLKQRTENVAIMRKKMGENSDRKAYNEFEKGATNKLRKQSTLVELLCEDQCGPASTHTQGRGHFETVEDGNGLSKLHQKKEKLDVVGQDIDEKQALMQAKREQQRAEQLQAMRHEIGDEYYEEFLGGVENKFRQRLSTFDIMKLQCPSCPLRGAPQARNRQPAMEVDEGFQDDEMSNE